MNKQSVKILFNSYKEFKNSVNFAKKLKFGI